MVKTTKNTPLAWPGFDKFDELSALLNDFAAHCYTDYRTACLLRDKSNSLGEADAIREKYEMARAWSLDTISPFGISFTLLCDNAGNWVAFPNLPDRHPFQVRQRYYFGKNYDWQEALKDAAAEMCGVQASDDVRCHMIMM